MAAAPIADYARTGRPLPPAGGPSPAAYLELLNAKSHMVSSAISTPSDASWRLMLGCTSRTLLTHAWLGSSTPRFLRLLLLAVSIIMVLLG